MQLTTDALLDALAVEIDQEYMDRDDPADD